MKTVLPKVIIKYGNFLDPILREYFFLKPENKGKNLIEIEDLFKNIENYKKEWKIYEEKILTGLLKLLPINFLHNAIDVYVVSYISPGHTGFSHPLTIRGNLKVEEFVNVLIHEILHVFLTANSILPEISPSKIIKEMFPGENDTKTINHIMINAILKYIHLDVLKDSSRLLKDKKRDCRRKEYKRAWDIVEEKGYKELINEFKKKIEFFLNK